MTTILQVGSTWAAKSSIHAGKQPDPINLQVTYYGGNKATNTENLVLNYKLSSESQAINLGGSGATGSTGGNNGGSVTTGKLII